MRDEDYISLKKTAHNLLLNRLTDTVAKRLEDIDSRCLKYVMDIADDYDGHNIWQIGSTAKQLRIMTQYPILTDKVHAVYRAIEGVWENGKWKKGGFLLTSIRGTRHYPLTPMQAFIYAFLYGPHHYEDMGLCDSNTELMPTECISPDGHLLDLRRVVRKAVIFVPRKNAKSDTASDLAILDFFFGDPNGDVMLTSNSQDQSAIIFRMIRSKLKQLDPDSRRIRITEKEISWKPGNGRENIIEAMSAGGNTKDGHFASLVLEDEYGSAKYINGHSDMASLVQVCESSQGPRREPLAVITTTAGNAINGPFEIYLNNIKKDIEREILMAD